MKLNKLQFIIGTELITILLVVFAIVPRETILFLTGILAFYILFAPIREATLFFILSIPLFVALPITESFDTMSNWRILLLLLFMRLIFIETHRIIKENQFSMRLAISSELIRTIKIVILRARAIARVEKLYLYVLLFFIITIISLINAQSIGYGLRKILFLVNAMMLFVVIIRGFRVSMLKDAKTIQIYSIFSLLISLFVGYFQILWVFFIPLYPFWQWWSNRVIPLFYGEHLANLLSYSNTWFSYYEESLPTLRIFSLFPDSHSFALFSLIGLIPVTYLWFIDKKRGIYILLGLLSLLSIVLSGSRGIWVSAILLTILSVVIYFIPKFSTFTKKTLISLGTIIILFFMLFPVGSLILSGSRMGNVSRGDFYESLSFQRAKSIFNLSEVSNKGRMEIWKFTLKSFRKNPILGVGIGNFPVVIAEDLESSRRGASAHNLYFDIVAEMGLLGLIVFLLIVWEIFKKAYLLFDREKNLYGIIFIFYFLWIMLYGLFDVVLLNDKVLLFFMTQLAVLYIIDNRQLTTDNRGRW